MSLPEQHTHKVELLSHVVVVSLKEINLNVWYTDVKSASLLTTGCVRLSMSRGNFYCQLHPGRDIYNILTFTVNWDVHL